MIFELYKHKFIFIQGKNIETGQAIFSKYKIINQGTIAFPESDNLVIFADVKKGKDTLRVYNIHLQSVKISPDVSEIESDVNKINQQKSEACIETIKQSFQTANSIKPKF